LVDFIVELPPSEGHNEGWRTLYVDGASNRQGSGAGVTLKGTDDISIDH